jgi:hypothetical protein
MTCEAHYKQPAGNGANGDPFVLAIMGLQLPPETQHIMHGTAHGGSELIRSVDHCSPLPPHQVAAAVGHQLLPPAPVLAPPGNAAPQRLQDHWWRPARKHVHMHTHTHTHTHAVRVERNRLGRCHDQVYVTHSTQLPSQHTCGTH